APLDEVANRTVGNVSYSMKLGFPWRVQDALKAHLMDLDLEQNEIQEYMNKLQDSETLAEEAGNIFDKYYDFEKIQKGINPVNWNAQSAWNTDSEAKEAFKQYAVPWLRRGMVGDIDDDTQEQIIMPDESSNRLEQEQIAAIQARLGVSPPEAGGFLNRIRNWIRLGGPEPKSASQSSPEFHPEFEGATPPSQQGGPRQGRRGRS
ncbi:MAG TPA: hypothetical protein DCS66_03855, partial [Flavobacteriaceae bacterium]|nr:hypothetical protein [Flavobacteriaceae bacterium]